MQSPEQNSPLTTEEYLVFLRIVIFQGLQAIIRSGDFKTQLGDLSREDRRKIIDYHEEIAEIAAKYFFDNNNSRSEDVSRNKRLFKQSVLNALKTFR